MTENSSRSAVVFAALLAGMLIITYAERSARSAAEPPPADMLAQNFQAEHEIGHRFQIDPENLPAPKLAP